MSLLIQFSRVTNIFYLVNAIFQSIPSISTNDPLATIIPLAFVVLLGMLRELLADLKRWQVDRQTNARIYTIFESPDDMKDKSLVRSDQLRVGDLIELVDNQTVPTDCILISTQESNG